ncbi:MAG: hypothetical protein HRU20_28545, partial [Pseudomonadales bacterium]|nr:hypothetical protein [Pseudomonadales bacterium]
PMVSDVPGDEYLSGRTILLYLSIFLCLQRLKNGSVVEIHPIQLRLAEILGQETKAFAEKYCQSNDYKTAVAESLPTIYERAVARMVGNPVGKDNA